MRRPSCVFAIDENPVLAGGIAMLVGKELSCRAEAISLHRGTNVELSGIDEDAIVVVDPIQFDGPFRSVADLIGHSVPAIAYCGDISPSVALGLINGGFHGVVSKTSEPDSLLLALQAVLSGAVHLDRSFAGALHGEAPSKSNGDPRLRLLSDREVSVLKATARGLSMKEIGRAMNLSVKTIETYKARARSKLNLGGKRDIVDYAIQNGWIQ